MEESKLDRQQEVEEGYRAELLLEQLLPYFEAMEAQLIQGIRQASVGDKEAVYTIKLMLNSLDSLKTNIGSVINTGKMAHKTLAEEPTNVQ